MNLNEFVEVFRDLEFNCFPLKHQSKEPAVSSWKEYQTSRYTGDFKEGQNVAIVTGKLSNLIVIDLDDKKLQTKFSQSGTNSYTTLSLWKLQEATTFIVNQNLRNFHQPQSSPIMTVKESTLKLRVGMLWHHLAYTLTERDTR